MVLVNAAGLLYQTGNLLLEGVPAGLRLPEVVEALRAIPGVGAVEDVHVWGICSHLTSLSAHLRVEEAAMARAQELLDEAHRMLRDRFAIRHATLELRPRRPG
jgi:cobalt-zinc-cadmium efflux system protein